MNDSGVVQAFDLHANKLSLIEKSARTLGLSCIRTGCRDARDPASEWVGTADRVICDVPCTSIGVIAAKPEIRYKDVTDISSLTAAQRDILAASASYLRSGGVLVYSTCSLDARENGEIVRAFLRDAPAVRYPKTDCPRYRSAAGCKDRKTCCFSECPSEKLFSSSFFP